MKTVAGFHEKTVFSDDPSVEVPPIAVLQALMLDATKDCIKILSPQGKIMTMNKAGCIALNVPENSGFGMDWLPRLPEEVHSAGQAALRDAGIGHIARFPGKSLSANGEVYWENVLTPFLDVSGRVLFILCVSTDVTSQMQLERQREQTIERHKLVALEMRHRIKNLFSVVSGLITVSKKEADAEDDPRALTEIFSDKLAALARASDAVFEPAEGCDEYMDGIDLKTLLHSLLKPYDGRCHFSGAQTYLRRDMMTTLVLFLHELATNSVKYGALSVSGGTVEIAFGAEGSLLGLSWSERGGPRLPGLPQHQGFGTEMVDRTVKSIGGAVERSWQPEGLVVRLHLPRALHPNSQ